MVTVVVAVAVHPLMFSTVTVYVPFWISSFVTVMIGSAKVLSKTTPAGPCHKYFTPPVAFNFNSAPVQTGELLLAVAVGKA